MPWSLLGLLLSLALAAVAFWRSRLPGGQYDGDVYAMTHVSHTRYALAGLGFAVLFGCIAVTHTTAILLPAGAAFALLAMFYGTSFLAGFSDENEDD